MRLTFVRTIALLLLTAGLASAQTLADLAKKEEERRKSVTPSKSYTNHDLAYDPAALSAERLAKAPASERPRIAATQFMGYFQKHTRGYAKYCQENWGIDLVRFTNAFTEAHGAELERAKKTIGELGITEESLWTKNEPLMREAVAREMTEIPGTRGSMAGCNSLNLYSARLAKDYHFKMVFPDAHAVLMGTAKP